MLQIRKKWKIFPFQKSNKDLFQNNFANLNLIKKMEILNIECKNFFQLVCCSIVEYK